jgi:manganese transport protein
MTDEAERLPPPSHTPGWLRTRNQPSLPEVHRSITIPTVVPAWRKMLAFAGPGFLVAVGYMDPGNWATDIQGGAQFGYTLLSMILISNFMAILLQHLCVKLGVVTGRDLAQACRDAYPMPVVWFLWILCELAIIACELAEVIGSAIALKILFGIPMVWGCIITCVDVMAVLYLQNRGFRIIEAVVIALVGTISVCFAVELFWSGFGEPGFAGVLEGFVPRAEMLTNTDMLYVGIGILGATVMPHNLYLHSAIVQTRTFDQSQNGKREAIKYATIDSTVALMFALLVNSAILILAAATFHWSDHREVASIQEAQQLLAPLLGASAAGVVFAVALLAAGQNSTLTGTLAGQIVLEGFLHVRLPPWLRRLVSRLLAVVPAVIVIGIYGEQEADNLLVFSQVILSMQLGFAIWPLMRFTNNKTKMGIFANRLWVKIVGWSVVWIIIVLNVKLLFDTIAPPVVRHAFYSTLGIPTPE